MPPFIDGKTEPSSLFYCDGDGNYVPFINVKPVNIIIDESRYCPESIAPSFTRTGELTFTMKLTPKSTKEFKKSFRSIDNRIRRAIRTAHRMKEKARRSRLKGGGSLCQKQHS